MQPPEASDEGFVKGAASCSTSGGACWTGTRVCPGVALLAAWFLSYPVYYFTGSGNASLVVLVVIATVLITGLHTYLWRKLRRAR